MEQLTKIVNDPKDDEIRLLKSQLQLVQILMNQNSQLEREIQRLNQELDESTSGIIKRGYLHKFRDREISYASRWGLRFFVLQGRNLSYYIDDRELRPRRTIDLTGCLIKDDGPTKGGLYHVFSIYWPVADDPTTAGNLLLRVSSENHDDAAQWIFMLRKAASTEDVVDPSTVNDLRAEETEVSKKTDKLSKVDESNVSEEGDDWGNTAIEGDDEITVSTLKRVKSSNKILERSQSRQGLMKSDSIDGKDKVGTPKNNLVNRHKKNDHTTTGKKNAATTPQLPEKKHDHNRQFPASKPIHVDSKASPLSSEVRPSEQNYRGFFNLVSLSSLFLFLFVSTSICFECSLFTMYKAFHEMIVLICVAFQQFSFPHIVILLMVGSHYFGDFEPAIYH